MVPQPPSVDDDLVENIIDVDISAEMEASFLEYAYSVIYSRAIPDARDGLKPVQRRILYSMDEMHLWPDRSHVKCARVVGDVMGKLHPHGDTAIYDALVRLGQSWAMRLPVIDGHGNFGSLDAGPAAMRYTECRMGPAALAMTESLDENTVDFKPNYDGKQQEPVVLPAAFPNMLVNGSTGIAVGMATNIPPHNLIETVQAIKYLLKNPDASVSELMRFVPGPDLPTGGTIVGLDGITQAYETGRGTFKIRAVTRVERVSPRRKGIIVTELPYMVGPERIIEQISTLVKNKKITGISDIKDLSDLERGTRLVIEMKNGINPDALLAELFKRTKLEDSFAINMVALVEGQPRTLSLAEALRVYTNHRLDVTLRRTLHRHQQASDDLHLVEGLLLAIVDIDDVIAIIRSSDDAAAARVKLMEAFDLTEVQADYILELRLRRLTKFSQIELEQRREELERRIAELLAIIESDDELRALVARELDEIVKQHGTPRRTVLLAADGMANTADVGPLEIPDDPCWVLMSSTGLLARADSAADLPTTGRRASHDVITSAVRTTARGDYGIITSAGRVIRAHAIELPSVPITADAPTLKGGVRLSELVTLDKNEIPLCVVSLDGTGLGWALGTAQGVVKRVNPDEVLTRDDWDIIRLNKSDHVVGALELQSEDDELVFVTDDAQLLHFPASAVRPQGRGGGGVAGIRLAAQASVVFFGAAPAAGAAVVTVAGSSTALPETDLGSVKVTAFEEFPGKGRATGGVRCHRFLKGEDTLHLAWVGPAPVIAAAASGAPVTLPPVDDRRDGSGVTPTQPIVAVGTRVHGSVESALPADLTSAETDEPEALF